MPETKKTQRASVLEARGRYKVGTIISKKFDGISYQSKIIKPYDGRYYRIEYKNGDEEDMTHSKVRKYLPKMKTTAGYGAALERILRQNVSHTAIALESINGDLREV